MAPGETYHDLLRQSKGPLRGGQFSFTPLPAVSIDLVLTELTATESPFCLSSCMLIDLFVLWIYMKEDQKQFSLTHLVSCKLYICDYLDQRVLYHGLAWI